MSQVRVVMSKYLIQMFFLAVGIGCLSLLAIQPFTLDQMPETADGILHLYRVAATDYSLKVDHPLWMRYSSGIVYGYGAPLFNYFPPLSYYLGSWLHTLGLTFVQSWLAMMAMYTVVSAFGMFLLGRIWTQSNVGGWVTAMAYIYAPYYLFDSVARGTSSELGALAVLPFVFYGFTRLALYGRRRDFLMSVIAFALFILMHTIMTLHGTALLGVYCLFLWLTSDDKPRAFFRLLLAGGLALTVTAFFWMPAILETDAVKINLIAENLNQIDVTRHLRPLHEIIALPHTADPTQMAQPIPITLSIVQLLLSAFGLVLAWNDRNRLFRNLLLMLWLVLLTLIFMNTTLSVWFWENLPLIGYTQFPWRILGLASLVLALMSGISVWLCWSIAPAGWIKTAVFSVLTLLIITYSIPWTYSLYLDDFELNDIRDVHNFERETGQLTVSSYSEYLPVSTDESQLDPDRLIERFEQGDIIPRLMDSGTVDIIRAEWGATSGTLALHSLESQTLIFDWLYVEGWSATINGQAVNTYPNIPQGLVAVDVPQGEFDLRISLQLTPIQSLSVLISFFGVMSVIGVTIVWRLFKGLSNPYQLTIDPERTIFVMMLVICVGVFLFKAIVLDATNTSFKSTRFGDMSSETVQIVPLTNFGDKIDLLDFEWLQSKNSAGFVSIKLYWKLHDTPIDTDYSSIVRMRDAQGIVIAESISFQPGGLSTSNWFVDHYIADTINLEIPIFTPPLSSYTFEVGLFDSVTLEPLSVINLAGNPDGIEYDLHGFNLEPEWLRRDLEGTRVQILDGWTNEYDEVGFYIPKGLKGLPDVASVGDEMVFDWTWQSLSPLYRSPFDDVHAQLIWRNLNRNIEISSEMIQLVIDYPTSIWSGGEVVTGHNRLIVPANIPAGDYQIGIQLLDENGNRLGDLLLLDYQMTITEPDRILEQPIVDVQSAIQWDNGLVLRGYGLDDGTAKFVWNTSQPVTKSLRLFVHVLDDNDLIIAQSDGIPVDWTRPTTSWIPEEFVTTRHQFDVPEGEYRIRVGWYDPVTGDRVDVHGLGAILLDDTLKTE